MTLRQAGNALLSEALSAFPELGHAFTTRLGGVSEGPYATLNLAQRPGETRENVERNRRIACEAAGAPPERLAFCRQVMGSEVVCVREGAPPRPEGDALVTNLRGVPLMTFSADCCLALLYDRRGAIANVHASRQGARGGIARKAVETMTSRFGTDPADIVAVIGPSIGPCCYGLKPEAAADWKAFARPYLQERGGRTYLDLKATVRGQLLDAGVPAGSIETCDLCTQCRGDWFYSYRRDGEKTGRFAAMIWLR